MSLTKVRNYAINDFITWYEADSLQISPKYQRNHICYLNFNCNEL